MLHRIQQTEAQLKTKLVKSVSDKRRSETRTKIELGGLVHKSELTKVLGITLGDELHSNPDHWEKEAILLGALIDIREKLLSENGEQLKTEFKKQGEISLKYDALKLDDAKGDVQ